MVNNSATFVILILGWAVLSEKFTLSYLTTLSVSFIGTIVVLLGTDHSASSPEATESHLASLLILLCNPIIIAAGVIAMRKMRKMHESVITTYMNLMLLTIMLVIVYASGSNLTPWYSFTWLDWVALVGLSTSNVGSQIFRFRAIQRS